VLARAAIARSVVVGRAAGCGLHHPSAYVCFFIGQLLASFDRTKRPAPVRKLLPVFFIIFGVFLCVLAEV
jgi:hypothetical protein